MAKKPYAPRPRVGREFAPPAIRPSAPSSAPSTPRTPARPAVKPARTTSQQAMQNEAAEQHKSDEMLRHYH
jgi:hypothetical protein